MISAASMYTTYTTFAASAMLTRAAINEFQTTVGGLIPKELREKMVSMFGVFFRCLHSEMTLVIDELLNYATNEVYEACEIYLRSKVTPSVNRIGVFRALNAKKPSISVSKGEKVVDTFEGIQLKWEIIVTKPEKVSDYEALVENRCIHLSFGREHMEKILNSFLPYILEKSEAVKRENRVVELHSISSSCGNTKMILSHPSTFDTLAMDPEMKKELMADLDMFLMRKKYYKRIGKAWKRGYLLYGPPGTGKSSLIAAIANYLQFDIYDLELTSLKSNDELRRVLLSTGNRSILVIEDIDCTIDLQDRESQTNNKSESQITLSGLLNFIDGLWSSCGDERIIIFTSNHKDKLDPALLRPGRMDMHIHMSYCAPPAFRILASNYLGMENHGLFSEIEELIREVEVTPAEIAEELLRSEDADNALQGLVNSLRAKKKKCIGEGDSNVEDDETNGAGLKRRESANKRGPEDGKKRRSIRKKKKYLNAHRGIRTHDHKVKSLALYQLS